MTGHCLLLWKQNKIKSKKQSKMVPIFSQSWGRKGHARTHALSGPHHAKGPPTVRTSALGFASLLQGNHLRVKQTPKSLHLPGGSTGQSGHNSLCYSLLSNGSIFQNLPSPFFIILCQIVTWLWSVWGLYHLLCCWGKIIKRVLQIFCACKRDKKVN